METRRQSPKAKGYNGGRQPSCLNVSAQSSANGNVAWQAITAVPNCFHQTRLFEIPRAPYQAMPQPTLLSWLWLMLHFFGTLVSVWQLSSFWPIKLSEDPLWSKPEDDLIRFSHKWKTGKAKCLLFCLSVQGDKMKALLRTLPTDIQSMVELPDSGIFLSACRNGYLCGKLWVPMRKDEWVYILKCGSSDSLLWKAWCFFLPWKGSSVIKL